MTFRQISHQLRPREWGKRVTAITVRLIIADCAGTAYFTDLFLQSGIFATGWVGHVCEIKWALDG